MYSSGICQAGATPCVGSSRRGQGLPDQPNSLLLHKDKGSARLSRFSAHRLAVPAVQARIQCWLVLGLVGGDGELHHHRNAIYLKNKLIQTLSSGHLIPPNHGSQWKEFCPGHIIFSACIIVPVLRSSVEIQSQAKGKKNKNQAWVSTVFIT